MDPDKKGTGDGDPITVEKLQEQIQNLNKGIGTYRDKAQKAETDAANAQAEAKAAREEAAAVKLAIEQAGQKEDDEDPAIKLAPGDQKKLEAWAKSQGFLTQADMEAERNRLFSDNLKNVETQAVEEFLKAHPDLNKDEEWTKVKEQFALYKQPTTLTGYRQLLTRIHKDLYGKDDGAARARAEIQTKNRLSIGGGSQKDDGDESAIEALQEKYPRLDRETIISRLKEVHDLAEARKARHNKK